MRKTDIRQLSSPGSLASDELSREVHAELSYLPFRAPWVASSGNDLDVAIIGAGQSGVSIAFALRQIGINRVGVFDASVAEQAGIWQSVARMRTLRTEKHISGPEQGIPHLTFRYWYTRLNGADAYEELGRIPREAWQAYLGWYRNVTRPDIAWAHWLIGIEPSISRTLALNFQTDQGERRVTARKIVLATGMGGFGHPYTPSEIAHRIPGHLRSHTQEPIDFTAFKGQRIGVIGAATSAFDAAATALEQGATTVHQLVRHKDLEMAPEHGHAGPVYGEQMLFPTLPDATRFDAIRNERRRGSVPSASVQRATQFSDHHLHFSFDTTSLKADGDRILILRDGQELELDHLLLATGYRQDVRARPELAAIAPHVLLWKHRMDIASEDAHWGEHPYVDEGFALQERVAGEAAWLRDVHVYTFAAIINHGIHIGDVASQAIAIPRLTTTIARDLFAYDQESRKKLQVAARSTGSARMHAHAD